MNNKQQNIESFEYIRKDDIIYGLYINSDYTLINMLDGKYTPTIGKFKVSEVKHITLEKRNVADRHEESEYKDFPCNKVQFVIKPLDKNAVEVLQRNEDMYGKITKEQATVTLDFTHNNLNKPMKHTDGKGTSLCLYLNKDDAKKYAYNFILARYEHINATIECMKNALMHNKKQLTKFKIK